MFFNGAEGGGIVMSLWEAVPGRRGWMGGGADINGSEIKIRNAHNTRTGKGHRSWSVKSRRKRYGG